MLDDVESKIRSNMFGGYRLHSFQRRIIEHTETQRLICIFHSPEDMIRLEDFLELIGKEGHFKLAGMLERGTI